MTESAEPLEPVRLIGFWIEGLSGALSHCVPQHLSGSTYGPEERAAITEFLRGGESWHQTRGYSWCRFGCDAPRHELGSGHRQQGNWAWPEGLAHYVEAHGVQVPSEIELAALGTRSLPEPETLGLSWWIAWCHQRTPEGFAEALESWGKREATELQQLRVRAEAKSRARAQAVEAERGTGSEKCIKAGCQGRGFAESVYCAWHLLTINGAPEPDFDCARAQASLLHAFLEGMGRSSESRRC